MIYYCVLNRNTSCCSSSIAESHLSVVSRLSRCFPIPRQLMMHDASSTARICSNGARLMLIYSKLITTCIFVLLSLFSSMIVPRVHTESRIYHLVWLEKQ